ncbi:MULTISPECIES: LLM class flavin-dependent oxidoreductase [Arthrobacter]|uniref:LLM class flavin-dependent oxidoreductase n=2 Tax=Arthrobacter TaxID=1663 RepID=A0ABU9KNV4_9MICC|nr:LLM class flavin-dependent oxidoreductase [Arthrobacter sp. YJM1]MDP5228591.1 LLM class flavin-dependent oxidoreductase [Arthrobacter sp. YJM1]
MSGFLILDTDDAKDLKHLTLAAESAGFHGLVFPAGEGLDPVQRAAFAGPQTHAIALIPEVDTVYTEPFHVATQLATLDYASRGRGGWLVVASDDARAAAAVGRPAADERRRRLEAAASVEANRRLWDSWEDDAVIKDVASGRYLDADRLHYADFRADFGDGEGYSVKGPSIIPRPPQGQLPVLAPSALVSLDGPLWPEEVDAVLVSASSVDVLRAELGRLREAYGFRQDGGPALVAELSVALDARGLPASTTDTALGGDGARFTGSAEALAGVVAHLLELADGVRLRASSLVTELPELAAVTLPLLRERGVLRPLRAGNTFRDILGLGRPANRHTLTAGARA